ncbi:MAG: fasciclin domain-containing protein [Pedobacter sp.]
MKNLIKRYFTSVAVCSFLLTMMISSCSKDYFVDGGPSKAEYNGTVLQYLESNPKFDTIAQIVKLAGMEDVFNNDDITFFAPTDEVIRRTIGQVNSNVLFLRNGLNQQLFDLRKDTIRTLADVPSEIWRKYLMRYVFKGKNVLKDYPQLDFRLKPLYPGGFYTGINGDLSNIGVVYNSANSVAYTGYRQLSISYIPDPANPLSFIPAAVASSDIQPKNGVVHALAITTFIYINGVQGSISIGDVITSPGANLFGFNFDFYQEVVLSK